MRYTARELRLAVLAVVLAVTTVVLLGLYLLQGGTHHSGSGSGGSGERAARTGQAATTAPPTTSQPTAAQGPLKAEYSVRDHWREGFYAEMVITNIGSQPIMGWTARLRLPPGVRVIQAWSADATQSGAALTLRSQPWNTYVAPGATVHFGFQATGAVAPPTSCTVNGSPC